MTLESAWNVCEEAQLEGQGDEGHKVPPQVGGELGVLGTLTYMEIVKETKTKTEEKTHLEVHLEDH